MSATVRLNRFLHLQQGLQVLQPLFAGVYPIALAVGSAFDVYDAEASGLKRYRLIKSMPAAGPIPGGVCAALALPGFGDKPIVIADPVLLDTPEGQVRLLGACVSCHLQQSADPAVCQRMGASDIDTIMAAEILFSASDLVWLYTTWVSALEGLAAAARIQALRRELRQLVTPAVWRKLLYLEWHHGLMRYLEDQIRARFGLVADLRGAPPDMGEVSFGYGGAKLIAWLEAQAPGLASQPVALFDRMLSLGTASHDPEAMS